MSNSTWMDKYIVIHKCILESYQKWCSSVLENSSRWIVKFEAQYNASVEISMMTKMYMPLYYRSDW